MLGYGVAFLGFNFTPTSSLQPILDSQAGHLGEVLRVPGQDSGVVGESDAGDFQVQGPDAQSLAPELEEQVCRIGIPRENDPVGKEINLPLEFGVGADLTRWITVTVYLSKPTSHLLLDGNEANGHFRVGGFKPDAEPFPSG